MTKNLNKFDIAQQIDTLSTLRPHAADANALLEGLELVNRLHWPENAIQNVITGLPLNSSATNIKNEIYNRAMGTFDKQSKFALWIKSLNLLMEKANYSLTIGDSFELEGGTTFERICTIHDNHGADVDTFVIHYHPGVDKAGAGTGYASDKHIKPVRGNTTTPRLYWDASIPDTLKKVLPTSPN